MRHQNDSPDHRRNGVSGTQEGHEPHREIGKAHHGVHHQLDLLGEGPAGLADFPVLPVEIHPVALKAHPEHLEGESGVLLIQHQQDLYHLPVQKIAVEAALRHVFDHQLAHQSIVKVGKKLLHRALVPFRPDRQHDLVAFLPFLIQLQDQLGILLQIRLFRHRAVAGADGKSRQDRGMLSEIPGQPHKAYILIHPADLVHDFPGIISRTVVHKDNLIFLQLMKNLLLHILVQQHQGIRVPVYGNNN